MSRKAAFQCFFCAGCLWAMVTLGGWISLGFVLENDLPDEALGLCMGFFLSMWCFLHGWGLASLLIHYSMTGEDG